MSMLLWTYDYMRVAFVIGWHGGLVAPRPCEQPIRGAAMLACLTAFCWDGLNDCSESVSPQAHVRH